MTSLIYSNIWLYRTAMSLLYGGKYHRRFEDILALIGPDTRSVCDLCFGDTAIADWCRSRGVAWTGVDLNRSFCARARKLGHHAIEGDLLSVDLPRADLFVIAGSLYHFHDRLCQLFEQVWSRTGRFIISEPVRNLSARKGLVGWWARRSANPGDAHAIFRYDEATLLDALQQQQARYGFSLRVVSVGRDLLAVMDRNEPMTADSGNGGRIPASAA